jgi:hypothetical protein
MTTASAMFIPAEALCGNSLIQHELYLSGNEQEILVKSRSVSRYHRMAKYQRHGSKERLGRLELGAIAVQSKVP